MKKLKILKPKDKFPPINERILRFIIKENEIREIWFDTVFEVHGKFIWENGEEVKNDWYSSGNLEDYK